MINAPQAVIDALNSDNFSYANLISVNLGDAYGDGNDVILYMTDYAHQLTYGGNVYTPNNYLTEIEGITRKATTGSDSVEVVFSLNDPDLVDAIKARRYINKQTSIGRAVISNGDILGDYLIPIRSAWGLNHTMTGDSDDRLITLVIDSVLGDLDGDNGWYAVNSSHQQRYPDDLIMQHGATVMTEEQQKKYTTNYSGEISQQVKPPAIPKIYGYKDVELVPIAMLKHRKTHTDYRHYFTTIIYCVSIGEVEECDLNNIREDDELNQINTSFRIDKFDVGGTSAAIRTPSDADESIETAIELNFWREGMDSDERARLTDMYGKGLTLLFYKNRNRDDWLSSPPKLTMPVKGAKVYDPRLGSAVYSRNPALQYADYLRSSEYGAGKRGLVVDDNNISELADHFEQIPDSEGNDGINSIFIDMQVDTGEPITDNMNAWIEGCRLYTSDYYGKFNIRVETISPTVLELTEGDLLAAPEYDSGEFTERINQLTYSIDQLVQDTSEDAEDGDLVSVSVDATFPQDGSNTKAEWLEEDGGIVNFESEQLDHVTELEQAYYWCMVDARISRKPQTLELVVGSIGWLIEVGDVINFSSNMAAIDELWRVNEVAEDDGNTELSLIAYDDDFYTPDPTSIPDPIPFAKAPTSQLLTPVTGVSVYSVNGKYYLNWVINSNLNVRSYAVEITASNGDAFSSQEVLQPPVLLPNIEIGNYTASIVSINSVSESDAAEHEFTVSPLIIQSMTLTPDNFNVKVDIVSNGGYDSMYRLFYNTDNDLESAFDAGTATQFTVLNLTPNTTYYFWARAVSDAGEGEDWFTGNTTTLNDPSKLGEFLNVDVKRLLLTASTGFYTSDTDGIVSPTAITFKAEVADIDLEADPLVWSTTPNVTMTVDGLSASMLNDQYGQHSSVEVTVATTSGSFSSSATILKMGVELDLGEIEEDIDELNVSIDDLIEDIIFNTVNTQKTVTETVASESTIRVNETAIATETEARTQQGIQLEAVINDQSALITRVDSVEVDIEGNSQAISVVQAEVSNENTGLAASYSLAQKAEITADGAAESVTVIENKVDNETTGLEATAQLALQAKTEADGATSATTVLSTQVNNETTGLSATNILAQQAKETADGNVSAVTQLQASIDGIINSGAPTTAELQLAVTGNQEDINSLQAEAYLFTNVDGNIAGMKASSTASATSLDFIGDRISFLRQDGSKALYADLGLDEWIFNGNIYAEDGYFKGDITGSSGTFNGTIYAKNIEGDVYDAVGKGAKGDLGTLSGGDQVTLMAGTINAADFDRVLQVSPVGFSYATIASSPVPRRPEFYVRYYIGGALKSQVYLSHGSSVWGASGEKVTGNKVFDIPSGSSSSYSVALYCISSGSYYCVHTTDTVIGIFKNGGSLT